MATQIDSVETMAELLASLGNISPERVIVHPAPGTATEADVLRALAAPRKRICELIEGTLVEKTMGFVESALAIYLSNLLSQFVRNHNLGLVTGADGTVRLWPGRVRIPDVAFYSWDRIPDRKYPTQPIPTLVPDLAIEVLSASNTAQEMLAKRHDLFNSGTRLLWEIDTVARTVSVYTKAEAPERILTSTDTLIAEPVLPKFSISLAEFFAELDRCGK
jgi:Uma2 family endonuclease